MVGNARPVVDMRVCLCSCCSCLAHTYAALAVASSHVHTPSDTCVRGHAGHSSECQGDATPPHTQRRLTLRQLLLHTHCHTPGDRAVHSHVPLCSLGRRRRSSSSSVRCLFSATSVKYTMSCRQTRSWLAVCREAAEDHCISTSACETSVPAACIQQWHTPLYAVLWCAAAGVCTTTLHA